MEFFKTNTKINFMGQRKWAALFSGILFICSIASFLIYGLNLGLDFTGGTQVEVTFQQAADVGQIRQKLTDLGFKDVMVQSYGSSRDILIRVKPQKQQMSQQQLQTEIVNALPGAKIPFVTNALPTLGPINSI